MTQDRIKEPPCFRCKHLVIWPICDAFRGDIPEEIRLGKNDHTQSFPGDNGKQFEPIQEENS